MGLDGTAPLAVQQWSSLIAVNYAARAKGVGRMDTDKTARAKCPEIQLVPVETVNLPAAEHHDEPPRASGHVTSATLERPGANSCTSEGLESCRVATRLTNQVMLAQRVRCRSSDTAMRAP